LVGENVEFPVMGMLQVVQGRLRVVVACTCEAVKYITLVLDLAFGL
jgi:hypothetical protein